MADVTLTIGGDASGAVQAAAQAVAALQSIGGFGVQGTGSNLLGDMPSRIAPATEGMRSMAQSTAQAAEGFALNRMEAGRLTAVLMQLGVVPPAIGRSLTMLMTSAFTPMTAGFALAIVAIQGVVAAFQGMGQAAEKEKTRVKGLYDEYERLRDSMEEVRRIRDEMTPEGAARAEAGRQALAFAGVPEDVLGQLYLGAVKTRPGITPSELANLGYAWMGREGDIKPEALGRSFAQGGRDYGAWIAKGGRQMATDPGAMVRIRASQEKAAEIAAMTPYERVIADLAEWAGVERPQAQRMLQTAEFMGYGPGDVPEGVGVVRRFAGVRQGIWKFAEQETPSGRREIHYHGMDVHNHFAGAEAPNQATDGPPRGPP